jgi:hypothetical protein
VRRAAFPGRDHDRIRLGEKKRIASITAWSPLSIE